MRRYAQVCAGVPRCTWLYPDVCGCAWVCMGMHGYAKVCACVWDEFSEFLPENRVPISADFNTYPIRILFVNLYQNPTHCAFDAHSLLSSSVKHLIDSLHKSLENR